MSNDSKPDDVQGHEAIARDLEERIASLLGLDPGTPINRKKRFDAIGMDSILSVDLLNSLETEHGLLPGTVLDDHPSVDQLATFLHDRNKRA